MTTGRGKGKGERRKGPPLSPFPFRLVLPFPLVPLGALLVGLVLRCAALGSVPPPLNQDEAVNGYDAYSLFLTGRDHHGHPFPFAGLESFGDWVSPLLTFLTAPAVGLFGLDVVVIRAVPAVLGALAIPVVYFLGRELFDEPRGSRGARVGAAAAWLLALSPWHVHLSRWAIPTALVPTMISLLMLAIVRAARRSDGGEGLRRAPLSPRHRVPSGCLSPRYSSRGVVATALVAGLTVWAYPTMKLYVPLLLAAAAAVYARPRARGLRTRRPGPSRGVGVPAERVANAPTAPPSPESWVPSPWFEPLAYAAVVFLLLAGPTLYLSTLDPGGRARLEQVSVFRAEGFGPALLARQYLSYFSPQFLFLAGDGDPMHALPGRGLEPPAIAPLLVLGLTALVAAVRRGATPPARRASLFLLSAFALYPTAGSLTVPSPHTLRAAHALPLVALIAGAGLVALLDPLRRLWSGRERRGAVLALLLVALGVGYGLDLRGRYAAYFGAYARSNADLWQYGLDDAVAYVGAREAEYDEIWMADINQPYIYVLFYTRRNPSEVHEELAVRRDPPNFNAVYAWGKHRFGAPPDIAPGDLELLRDVRGPDGSVQYQVRGGETPDGRRILLVSRPPADGGG